MSKKKDPPSFFYSIRSGSGWFVSNDAGRGLLLSEAQFRAFSRGGPLSPALRETLAAAGFLRERLDLQEQTALLGGRFLAGWRGPAVHVISVTARCNSSCLYCAAASPRARHGQDMSPATASAVVDFIFGVKNPSLLVEFQGGEPLLNFGAVERITGLVRRRAQKEGREARFSIVTNLSLMDEKKLAFLRANRVTVCTSLDGPASLHDSARRLPGGAHAPVARWLPRIVAASRKDPGFEAPNAICTVTRAALTRPREIVDEFLRLGLRRVQLGPLDPLGLAAAEASGLASSPEEFAAFYAEALDYMLELNARGVPVYEKGARAFAARVLNGEAPRYHNLDLAMRLAYNWDGSVYGSDEARMLSNSGDEFFRLGSALSDSFEDVLRRPLARALLLSCFQGLSEAGCARCAFSPYCRVSPVYNYAAQGSFWGDKATSGRCALFKAVYGAVLERLRRPAGRAALAAWAGFDG